MKKAGRMLKPVVSLAIAAATVLTMALCLPFNTLDTEAAKKITEADINAVRDRIKANEKKIKEYQDALASIGKDLDSALVAKAQLDQQIQYIQSNVEETEELIVRYEQLIKEKEALIADRESQISDKYNDFLERLRISYEDGSQNYLELLISSDSLVDFITRIDNLGSVLTYEQRTMDELEKEVSDLDELKKSLDIKKSEYVELGKYQSQSKADLNSKLKEAEQLVKKLQSDENAAKKAQQNAAKQDAALDKELEKLLKEYEKQQQAEQAGAYLWPLDSNYRSITGASATSISGRIFPHPMGRIYMRQRTERFLRHSTTAVTAIMSLSTTEAERQRFMRTRASCLSLPARRSRAVRLSPRSALPAIQAVITSILRSGSAEKPQIP